MLNDNYLKIGCAIPKVYLGKPLENAKEIIKCAKNLKEAAVVVFPEMCLTGYSLGDWVYNDELLKQCDQALELVLQESEDNIWLVGGPKFIDNGLYNVCYIIQNKEIIDTVVKQNLINYREFDEKRYFKSGANTNYHAIYTDYEHVNFGVEIGSDLYSNNAPHIEFYNNGADIIFNPACNPFNVGKNKRVLSLCENASYLGNGAYVYVSTGVTETSSDIVMAPQIIVCECGEVVYHKELMKEEETTVYVDIDLTKIRNSKRMFNNNSYESNNYELNPTFIKVPCTIKCSNTLTKKIDRDIKVNPFHLETKKDIEDVINALCNGLYYRLNHIGIKSVTIGVSGGLDSTLALLIINKCFEDHGFDKAGIIACTMPGLGTGSKSKNNAYGLCENLGINLKEVNIKDEVLHHFDLIGKNDDKKDVTYENIQARYRTLVLMDLANMHNAIVCGTGDMSEIALGWSTFNGDQMSMYNINGGLPKTIIREVCAYFKELYPKASKAIQDVIDLPISPELLGSDQLTEDMIGKYEINDFLMYHVFNNGASRDRIAHLLNHVFNLSIETGYSYYDNFMKRFKRNQFKRLAGPESIKIFEFSFGPRSDYKFPGDMKN